MDDEGIVSDSDDALVDDRLFVLMRMLIQKRSVLSIWIRNYKQG